jgi:hypothetical protein
VLLLEEELVLVELVSLESVLLLEEEASAFLVLVEESWYVLPLLP